MNEIEEFKKLINSKLYYEAHEELEKLWFPIRKNKTDYCMVLKGFINAAVSMELYKRDKYKQSSKIKLVYKKYVTNYRIVNTSCIKEFNELKLFIDKKFEKMTQVI